MSRLIPSLVQPPPDLTDEPIPPQVPFLEQLRQRADNPQASLRAVAVYDPTTRTRTGVWSWLGWPCFRVVAQVQREMREGVYRNHYQMEDANGRLWYGCVHPAAAEVDLHPTRHFVDWHGLPMKWRPFAVPHLAAWPEPIASLVNARLNRPILDRLELHATELAESTPEHRIWNVKLYNGKRKLWMTWQGAQPTVKDVIRFLFATKDKRIPRLLHPHIEEARKAIQ